MSPELASAFNGLMLAALTASTGCIVALGIAGVGHIRRLSKKADAAEALEQKRHELAQLEVDEKIRAKLRAAALDAASIAQETSYGRSEPLSGKDKAALAADKLREMEPSLSKVERSVVTDLVKLGAAQLRSQSSPGLPVVKLSPPPSGTYLLTPSQAPPPDVVRSGAPDNQPTLPPLKRPLRPRKETR
jgi:hypothetical protein